MATFPFVSGVFSLFWRQFGGDAEWGCTYSVLVKVFSGLSRCPKWPQIDCFHPPKDEAEGKSLWLIRLQDTFQRPQEDLASSR